MMNRPLPARRARLALVVTLGSALAVGLGLGAAGAPSPPSPSPAANPISITRSTWEAVRSEPRSVMVITFKNSGPAFAGTLVLQEESANKTPPTTMPGEPPPPELTGFTTIRRPLDLGAGTQQTVTVPLLTTDRVYRPQIVDADDRVVIGGEPVAPTVAPAGRLGVLTDSLTGRAIMPTASVQSTFRFGSAADFPENPELLHGLGAIAVVDFDSSRLRPPQIATLSRFVNDGGVLFLGGGDAAERTVLSLPPDLTPLLPNGRGRASLAPLSDLTGSAETSSAIAAAIATGSLVSGTALVSTPEGNPLLVEARVGSGRVFQFAFDPLAEILRGSAGARAGRDYAFIRAGLDPAAFVSKSSSQGPLDDPFALSAIQTRDEPANLAWAGAGLLGYALVVGPVAVAWSRRRSGRGASPWLVAPTAAVVVAGLAWGASQGPLARKASDRQVQVQVQDVAGNVRLDTWHRLAGSAGGDGRLAADSRAVLAVEPHPLYDQRHLPDAVSRLVGGPPAVAGDTGGAEAAGTAVASLKLEDWPAWADRQAETSSPFSRPREPLVETDLRVTGDRVVGTVVNRSTGPMRHLRAVAPDGSEAELATSVGSGSSVEVDAELAVPRALKAPVGSGFLVTTDIAPSSGSVTAAERRNHQFLGMVARRSEPRPGQISLMAIVEPRAVLRVDGARPRIQALAAMLANVRLKSADSVAGGVVLPLRVCACGIFEYGLPDGLTTPLAFRSGDSPGTRPEDRTTMQVFNWISRSWRVLPVDFDAHSLLEGEVSPSRIVWSRSSGPPPKLELAGQ